MENLKSNPWYISLSKQIDKDKTINPIDNANEDWEFIDSMIINLGTISHEKVNINEIRRRAVLLLETKTKDMRVLTHFLRTLQHNGNTNELLLAFLLFHRYIELFWNNSAPKMALKTRLAVQILQRFSNHIESFNQNSFESEQDFAKTCLYSIAEIWQTDFPKLAKEANLLAEKIQHKPKNEQNKNESVLENKISELDQTKNTNQLEKTTKNLDLLDFEINGNNERSIKKGLFTLADLLFEQFPEREIAYRLRRAAIWLTIDGVLIADENNVTQLSVPISPDRLSEYLSAIPNSTIDLLRQVENSVTLSPYWFEGHFISAKIAKKLQYNDVSNAILQEVQNILTRTPALKTFKFADNSPFVTENVQKWLNNQPTISHTNQTESQFDENVKTVYQNEGLEAALKLFESPENKDMRSHFYNQLNQIELLEYSGLNTFAIQQRKNMLTALKNLTIDEWEPSFFIRLNHSKREQSL